MAQGFYRASGIPAVVLVHVAVGTANTVCSLMNACRANIPVLLVAGRNPLSQDDHVGSRSFPIHWGQDAFDQNALVREYTKWEHELRAYQDVDALIDRALVIAMSEPRGPVYLTLPRELLADVDTTTHHSPTGAVSSATPSADAIEDVAVLIAAAKKPAIVTSTIGVNSESRILLEEIAEEFTIPVIQSWPYAVNLRSAHPMNLRTQGQEWLADADVILTIDVAVPWVPKRFTPRPDATVVHLSADPSYSSYPYRDFPSSRLIAGSSLAGLEMLQTALRSKDTDDSQLTARAAQVSAIVAAATRRRRARVSDASSQAPIDAAWIAQCVNNVKDDHSVLVNELGISFDCLEFSGSEIFVGETTAGALGSGIGIGLGAKLASPDRTVICCVGDGSFMFGNPTPAFVVSRALGIPILIIVSNNGMWYAVQQTTLDMYPDGAAAGEAVLPLTRFGAGPDYAALAAACGAWGERVTEPAMLEGAMHRGLEQTRNGKAALIDVITKPGTR
jgi:acetolactate synthase-1/2/3 large subunit